MIRVGTGEEHPCRGLRAGQLPEGRHDHEEVHAAGESGGQVRRDRQAFLVRRIPVNRSENRVPRVGRAGSPGGGLFRRPDQEDGRVAPAEDLLGDSPEDEPARAAFAVRAHDHEVRGELRRVRRDAVRHVAHLRRVHVRLHAQAGKHGAARNLLQVGSRFVGGYQVPVAVHLRGRVLFYDMHEGQLGVHARRHLRRGGDGRLRQA